MSATIPIHDYRETPGPWWISRIRDGLPIIQMKCPNGHIADLVDHAVDDDTGEVTPSVDCPEPGCGFHTNVRLESFYRRLP